MFNEYLSKMRTVRPEKKRTAEEIDRWNETKRLVQDAADEGKTF